MKYSAYDYFRKYLSYLSKTKNLNLRDEDISTYLRALSNFSLVEESFKYFPDNKEIYFDINMPNAFLVLYIDTADNSLNCITDSQEVTYRIKLVNDKLYYSIYFNNSDRKDLKGIYFYESDEIGDVTYKFYDGEVIERLSNYKLRNVNLIFADDSMLQNHGFSPDYEESHEYKGMLEFDAAKAFNNLLLSMNYDKTIEFISSINKKTESECNLKLVKRS